MQLQLYKNKITLKIYKVHIWHVAGYLTDSNVPHNIVVQKKQLNIYFGSKVSTEQVVTMSSLPSIKVPVSPPIKNTLFSPMYTDLPNL